MPKSTRPAPMITASAMYTIWTVRRRPPPLRSNSMDSVFGVEGSRGHGAAGGTPLGARSATVEQRGHQDRPLVEDEQREHQHEHGHGILAGQQHGDDRDDQERVTAVGGQPRGGGGPPPGPRDDADRGLEKKTPPPHEPHREREKGPGPGED